MLWALGNGPSPQHNDAIVYDVGKDGRSESGWGHPTCGHNAPQIAKQLGAGIVSLAQWTADARAVDDAGRSAA
ncbi:MAG TPA: hypothetical protein VFL51_06890 [Pseudolabrys sp.]|nr:hypothetical protein [Pseudolabrys sp.]